MDWFRDYPGHTPTIKAYATARPRRGVGESHRDHMAGTNTGPPTGLGATTVFAATRGHNSPGRRLPNAVNDPGLRRSGGSLSSSAPRAPAPGHAAGVQALESAQYRPPSSVKVNGASHRRRDCVGCDAHTSLGTGRLGAVGTLEESATNARDAQGKRIGRANRPRPRDRVRDGARPKPALELHPAARA
jgi:hypothetical protein